MFVLDCDQSLLVVKGGFRLKSIEKLAFAILDEANDALSRNTVHVDIEDIQEDCHANSTAGGGLDPIGLFDLAVGGRYDDTRALRDTTCRIAEEPKEKRRQHERNQRQRKNVRREPDDDRNNDQRQPVEK